MKPIATKTLVNRLRKQGDMIQAYFSTLTLDQWGQVVYSEKVEWRVRDVLAHLISVENSLQSLIQDINSGGQGAPEGFSIDEFNNSLVTQMNTVEPLGLLTAFQKERTSMVDLVSCLGEADYRKSGRHPYLGIASIADIIRMAYLHNQIHLRDVRETLASRKG